MPKLQAAVPAGAPPNALLRVRLPDGNEVNVRIPEGLKPGDEFIFEVSSIGEIGSGGGGGGNVDTVIRTAKGGGSTNGGSGGGGGAGWGGGGVRSNKKTSKNPKKRRSNNSNNNNNSNSENAPSGGRGDRDQSYQQRSAGDSGSFVAGFFNMYNQVYDILSQNNAPAQPPRAPGPSSSSRRSGGGGAHRANGGTVAPVTPTPCTLQPLSQSRDHRDRQQPSSQGRVGTSAFVPRGFLDRELTGGRDFLTALAVGMFVGTSIVAGFLAGVLYVTPIAEGDKAPGAT